MTFMFLILHKRFSDVNKFLGFFEDFAGEFSTAGKVITFWKGNYLFENVITFCYNVIMNIQERLKQILAAAQWSQDDLAHYLEVAPKTLSFWMTGKTEPRDKSLEKIQELYFEVVGRESVEAGELERLKGLALGTRLDLDELIHSEDLMNLATLYLTYHTNNIEGSTMTLEEVATVLDDENAVITNKTYREQAEARNHRAAFRFLLGELKRAGREFRWTTEVILETHQRLMNSLMDDAGQFRHYGVRVLGSRVARANPMSVPQKMAELVKYMNRPIAKGREDVIERLAKTHAVFELIHPFGDGNGRVGRLIMFVQAMQYGIVPPLVLKERKRAYYRYLSMADETGEYDLLAMLVAESVLATDKLLR